MYESRTLVEDLGEAGWFNAAQKIQSIREQKMPHDFAIVGHSVYFFAVDFAAGFLAGAALPFGADFATGFPFVDEAAEAFTFAFVAEAAAGFFAALSLAAGVFPAGAFPFLLFTIFFLLVTPLSLLVTFFSLLVFALLTGFFPFGGFPFGDDVINSNCSGPAAFSLLTSLLFTSSFFPFTFITKQPPVSRMILKELNIEKGSKIPNREKVGKLTKTQVKKIANNKLQDMRAASEEAAMMLVMGTARSMGVDIIEG